MQGFEDRSRGVEASEAAISTIHDAMECFILTYLILANIGNASQVPGALNVSVCLSE